MRFRILTTIEKKKVLFFFYCFADQVGHEAFRCYFFVFFELTVNKQKRGDRKPLSKAIVSFNHLINEKGLKNVFSLIRSLFWSVLKKE